MCLRYGWDPPNLPLKCPCSADFSVAHALHCAKGGYTIIRHNEIRETFAKFLNEKCKDVQIEPKILPVGDSAFSRQSVTTEDEARLDVKASGLWGSVFERTFFDVKIFNPHARTCPKTPKEAYAVPRRH